MNEQNDANFLNSCPPFFNLQIKQPSNLRGCKRNIAHLCLARQHLMIIYEYRIIDIYHGWTIRNNLRLWGHDFLLVMFVDASKFKLLVLRRVPIFLIGHFGLWDT
jgi:hypothetical protein